MNTQPQPADEGPPIPTSLAHAVKLLTTMDDVEFNDIVDKNIRANIEGEIWASGKMVAYLDPFFSRALRSKEVCERWYQSLVQMKKSTEMTIAAKTADMRVAVFELEQPIAGAFGRSTPGKPDEAGRERMRFLKWKAGAVRFLTGVEKNLSEANACRRALFGNSLPSVITAERDRLSETVRELYTVIRAHRDRCLAHDGYEPTLADMALWSVLDD